MMEIFNNDCLEKLKEIDDKRVDCVICDLPYGTTACKWDNKIDLDELWRELKRVAKNDNTPYFFFCDMRFAVEIINSNPKMYRYDLVWYKPNSSVGHLNSGRMPLRNHELLLVFYKKLPTYNKKKYHKKIRKVEYKKDCDNAIYGKIAIGVGGNERGLMYDVRLPTSVIECSAKKLNMTHRFHQTQKPQGILEWIIKYYTNEDDTVLDPTMGSGSTGVACKTLNRKFIGIELDEKYYEISKKRLDL